MSEVLKQNGLEFIHTQLQVLVQVLDSHKDHEFNENELVHLIDMQGLTVELGNLLHEIL